MLEISVMYITIFFGVFVVILIIGELIARYMRFADYLIYRRSPDMGYAPEPNSSGLMRRRYRWRFNHMGIRSDFDGIVDAGGIVLVGDSIVEGGAMVDQDDTLGSHFARAIDKKVYPVGAGGWSLPNELAFLRRNSELLNSRTIVMVINSDDLCGLNFAKTAYTHLESVPKSHFIYLIGRFFWNCKSAIGERLNHNNSVRSTGMLNDGEWMAPMVKFLQIYKGTLIWVLYPDQTEFESGTAPCAALRPIGADRVIIVDLVKGSKWNVDCYHDRLHPNSIGRKTLADMIATEVLRADQRQTVIGY